MMPLRNYTSQQIEDVRKKMSASRNRLKSILLHMPGGWTTSFRLDENNHTIEHAGRQIRFPYILIRILREGMHDGKKSCPVYLRWAFPVGKIPTVEEFTKNGSRALRTWNTGVDQGSFADDVRDIQDASNEIPKILDMMPQIARLCHPDPLVNMDGEGEWKKIRKSVRKKR
jgi:hypothetical protein